MTYPRQTFAAIEQQIISDILSSNLPGMSSGLLPVAAFRVLARVDAALANGLYGYIDYVSKQSVPFTSTGEFLEGWAALKGIYRIDATPAGGTLAAQFSAVSGTDVPQGTIITRDDQFTYKTTADAIANSSGTVIVSIQATTSGSLGNADAGIRLTLSNPISGVSSTGSAILPITGGADQEQDSSLLTRTIQAFSSPAQGGSESDYQGWAESVAGISRVWIYANNAPTTNAVQVYIMLDDAEAATNGFPVGTNGVSSTENRWPSKATGDQLRVANYLQNLKPMTDMPYVLAPLPQPITFTFSSLTPNTTANQTAISTALASLFVQVGTPLVSTIPQSSIFQAINAVPGVTAFALTNPLGNITTNFGYLPTVGTINWPSS